MARRVFFSFHYADIWRVMQVRNSWNLVSERESAGFVDSADFEKVERQGDLAIQRWIDAQLEGTSTTVVLVGAETSSRKYVQYEIKRSYERGNGLLGIWLDNIKDQKGDVAWFRGENPFHRVASGPGIFSLSIGDALRVPMYDWVAGGGRVNIARWIEAAPRKA